MIRNANTKIKKLEKDKQAMETGFIYRAEVFMVHMLREFKEADKMAVQHQIHQDGRIPYRC